MCSQTMNDEDFHVHILSSFEFSRKYPYRNSSDVHYYILLRIKLGIKNFVFIWIKCKEVTCNVSTIESMSSKKESRKDRKEDGISEICRQPVVPLGRRNNDYSDDDKRLVIRYSAICRRERPSGILIQSNVYTRVYTSCNLATNNEAKQHHRPTKEATT